jgi:multidrug efflux pump subunit AcrA (membrane-fusion protein)
VLAVLAAGWAYWTNVKAVRPAMDMSMRISAGASAFPVVLTPVERSAVRGTVTYTGSVAAFNEEEVYPRVTGRIIEMPVYPGDTVRPGQVLARLDDVELTSRVREAEAMAATARAGREQMEADLAAARQGVVQMERELAMVEAEAAYTAGVRQRAERLVASGAIARQEYENDRAMAVSAEAKRDAARAKLDQARAMETAARKKLDAAESMVAQSAAAASTARIVRDYVTITAPAGGHVVKRLVAPGVLVQPGMPILKLAQIDRVRLQANVGERDLGSIQIGAPVTVTTTGRRAVAARVTSVFPFIDQGPRTAVVEAVIDNRDRSLLPGQYVSMEFVTGERGAALTVPRSAVRFMAGKTHAWVARDGRAEPREIGLGLEGPERVEVVSGLAAGEHVVARGAEGLYAGARIAVVSATTATPPPTSETPPSTSKEKGHAGH